MTVSSRVVLVVLVVLVVEEVVEVVVEKRRCFREPRNQSTGNQGSKSVFEAHHQNRCERYTIERELNHRFLDYRVTEKGKREDFVRKARPTKRGRRREDEQSIKVQQAALAVTAAVGAGAAVTAMIAAVAVAEARCQASV
ncbi:hypothetical protein M0802_007142 [Mischocyttarus mexicanus]|nr:hypothetical protein M0802_007142 [Mischocyttarus mexicanus]